MRLDTAWFASQSLSWEAHSYDRRQMYFTCKRLLDISIAGALLLALSPFMLVIAILVMLDTPGPAIFRQERVGLKRLKNSKVANWNLGTFTIYKYRSMYQNSSTDIHKAYVQAFIHNDRETMAELQDGDKRVRKLVKDSRVTGLGRFLRKSSLDELPQLWNVLKGDMSLVGPRPAIPYEVNMYEPWHHRRLEAMPGITGLCQVTLRCSGDFDELVKLDIKYVESQSIWLDLKILLKTPLVVIRGKGAV